MIRRPQSLLKSANLSIRLCPSDTYLENSAQCRCGITEKDQRQKAKIPPLIENQLIHEQH